MLSGVETMNDVMIETKSLILVWLVNINSALKINKYFKLDYNQVRSQLFGSKWGETIFTY